MTVRKKTSYALDIELSVSRINRLLRPLRNKCAILASATSPSGPAVPTTYGSSSSALLETFVPPTLDVLHDPKLVISCAHQESRSLDTLARQIYAVSNAYRNVVQAALFGGLDGSRRDVLALTDICAASIGQHIKGEVARCLALFKGEPDEDDAKEAALVDELYESVPARYRSRTLIAHATSEIVDTCPNRPMLMLSLLGVTLNHGLYTESKTFLRLFLVTLIRSRRRRGIIPPPIAHPMHPSYLVDLCNEWTRLAPEHYAGPFTHRSFAAVTLEVLIKHGSATAWTCKSITRLVQLLRTRDFECFLAFLHGLIETFPIRPRHLVHDDGCGEDRPLLWRLAKWAGVITSDFFSSQDGARSGGVDAHQLYSIVEILASAYDTGLHLVNINDDKADMRDPQGALVCAATHCLSTTIPLFSSPRRNTVLELLHDVSPNSTTYKALAGLPLERLRVLAGALRANNLGSLEHALLASAVEHSSSSLPVVDPALLATFADVVERGREEIVVGGIGRGATRTRSPPRKRARREMTASHPRLRFPSSPTSFLAMTISVASTPSLSSSYSRSLSTSPAPVEIMETFEDEELTQRSRVGMRFGSCADFSSVLADALRERKDLKEERRRASLRSGCCYGRSASPSESEYSCAEEDTRTPALPSDEDVLDLFAYEDPC